MVTKQDLETKRTPEDLHTFVQSTLDLIRNNQDKRKEVRLKKILYKELIEEIYPFSIFCKLKYEGIKVLCQPILGNQGYDAIIETENGEAVEKVELSWPIDGQKNHSDALALNKKGHTRLEIRDVNDSAPRDEVIERILKKAKDKALKDYLSSEGSSLIFVLDIAPHFGMKTIEHPDEIEYLIQKLREIPFKVKNVYLLLLPMQKLVELR